MPEISRFLGIIIYMHFNDHNPPHFHVQYNDYKAIIEIESLKLLEGKLPSRVLGLITEWAILNQKQLSDNWESIRDIGKFNKIKPLVS